MLKKCRLGFLVMALFVFELPKTATIKYDAMASGMIALTGVLPDTCPVH